MDKLKFLIYFLIAINIALASRWIIDGNILFHTDIARDFLLIEDIVDNRHLTLIGPRSGAIPGVFHGPLWLYINVPAYMLGNGNPVIVGWFWVGLYLLSLFIIYYVGKKMFDETIGLLSALLLSSVTLLGVRSLFNPYGALMLFPVFFYTFINYLKNKDFKTLILSIFILGLIIQFQMAFGGPILILTGVYLVYFLYKHQKLKHIFAFLILLVPLSSFLLFDLRNKFLQTHSVINYLSGVENHGKENLSFLQLLQLRFQDIIYGNFGEITYHTNWLSVIFLIFMVVSLFLIYKRRKLQIYSPYLLFGYYFIGFWLISFFFKGPIWSYYYIPFIPVIILIFCSFNKAINKKIFYPLFVLLLVVSLVGNIKDATLYQFNGLQQDVSTWKFNLQIAEDIYNDNNNEFGYYIFTPDLYGYSPRYAMNYYQKISKNKISYPFDKKAVTYLLIAPPPEYGKDPNSIWYQKNTNSNSWKQNDVRIDRQADKVTKFDNGFIVEKYNLSQAEIKIQSNQFLIQSIFFR